MHIWTDNPATELWRRLRYFRSPANVYNVLSGKVETKRKVVWEETDKLQSRSYDIAACIRQADEYYRAAENSGLVTEPLLQFYGAQSLAKACILANDKSVDLANLNYHGLSTRPSTAQQTEIQKQLREYSDNYVVWEIETEFAVTHDGVFPKLCAVASDIIPARGQVLRFKELVRLLPDMAQLYSRHYGEPSHCFYLYGDAKITADGHYQIFIETTKIGFENFKNIFPEFYDAYEVINMKPQIHGFRSVSPMKEKPDFIRIVKGTVAGEYLVKPHLSGIYTTPAVLYAVLFILSNMVRYKPSFWMRVIEGEKTGAASIVEDFSTLAKRRFPHDVLELLWDEMFTFGTPGYMV
jgi:hypothetical protein